MSTFFNTVHITNFKSLKNVTLSDCKRINLLIGKPNVGKSNILEAIGLFSLPYLKYNKSKKITQFVRIENIAELFFDGDINEKAIIKTDDDSYCTVNYLNKLGLVDVEINLKNQSSQIYDSISPIFLNEGDKYTVSINNNLDVEVSPGLTDNIFPFPPKVKLYKFSQNYDFKKQDIFLQYLLPAYGTNLLDIIQIHKELRADLSNIFSDYGLKIVFDTASHSLKLMKDKSGNEIFLLPYSSIADTLQRVIFFKTAIASNKDSILLFEEPEAHCFPPYIAHFTQDVINSINNQFFIATHSPYVLNDFLETEETRKELAIFIADFKDGQTVINRLTDDEVNEVYDYGIDVFFNYERFTRHDG